MLNDLDNGVLKSFTNWEENSVRKEKNFIVLLRKFLFFLNSLEIIIKEMSKT